ncbi:MAG: hypothetical protein ACK5JS_08580 [Mangrovibacterium sp.]
MHLPKLFHFNSTCEIAIANGSPYFNTTAILKRFEQDFASIMQVFASENDYILSEEKIDAEFLKLGQKLGFPPVNFVSLAELKAKQATDSSLRFDVQSWGDSPAEDFYLKDIKHEGIGFTADKLRVIERAFAAKLLETGLATDWQYALLGEVQELKSSIIRSEDEAEQYLYENLPVVFKSPFSSSGRGLMVLRKPDLNEANRKWINTIIAQQGYVVASKWLDKLQDFSFQFDSTTTDLHFEGVSYFCTNSNGQYQAHELNRHDFVLQEGNDRVCHADLVQLGKQLQASLLQSDLLKHHCGKFGVDGLIYRSANGLRLHPLVEINPRHTMGAVSLALQKFIHEEARGYYRMHTVGKESYQAFIEAKQQDNPPVFEGGKMKKGVMSLTPFSSQTKFGAYVELGLD